MGLLTAYAAPAAAVWALVGLLANVAPIRPAALGLTVAYGIYYGLIETAGRPGPPAPGRTWQVPSQWVDNTPRWRRILVWGTLLGPGFATRNPYAGFGLLVLVVCSVGSIRVGVGLAAALGLLHSLARGRAAAGRSPRGGQRLPRSSGEVHALAHHRRTYPARPRWRRHDSHRLPRMICR